MLACVLGVRLSLLAFELVELAPPEIESLLIGTLDFEKLGLAQRARGCPVSAAEQQPCLSRRLSGHGLVGAEDGAQHDGHLIGREAEWLHAAEEAARERVRCEWHGNERLLV